MFAVMNRNERFDERNPPPPDEIQDGNSASRPKALRHLSKSGGINQPLLQTVVLKTIDC
jgi:hypothetical protein